MVRVEANVRLSKEITIGDNEIKTGFRVTMKLGNKGYITQLIAIGGENIPLDRNVNVYIDILHGELDIEKFINNTRFDLISGKKQGEGRVLCIKEICVEKDIFFKESQDRQREIVSIITNSNLDYKYI